MFKETSKIIKLNRWNIIAIINTKALTVGQINEDDLLLIDKEFILQDFKGKEADIIYRVKLNDENKTEVFLLPH